jgi:hypothetical protein
MRPTIPADWEQRGQTFVREFRVRLEISNLHHHELTPAELRLAAKVDAVLERGV